MGLKGLEFQLMVKEQEGSENPKPTPEQLQSELLDYLKDAKVGTPKYIALSDSIAQEERLTDYRYITRDLERRLQEDSPYHLELCKIDLMRNAMAQVAFDQDKRNKEATITGYRQAFRRIQESFDKLSMESRFEVAQSVLDAPEE